MCKMIVMCKNDAQTKKLIDTLMNINDVSSIMSNEMTFRRDSEGRNKHQTIEELGLKIDSEDLTLQERADLTQVLKNNADLFATSLLDLPGTHLCEYEIDTGDAKPINCRPYRLSPTAQGILDTEIDQMLKAGVIRPSDSNWGSPVMLVKKKSLDGKPCFRVVIDYRKLNAVSKPIAYTIPKLEDIVDAVGHAKPTRFSIMDLRSGYFQIPIKEGESKHKTAFNTQNNKFEFNVASFGLQGLPAYFSKIMSSIFRGISYKYMVHYIDDLLIYSPDVKTHISHLQSACDRIRGANLRIHPQKSLLYKKG